MIQLFIENLLIELLYVIAQFALIFVAPFIIPYERIMKFILSQFSKDIKDDIEYEDDLTDPQRHSVVYDDIKDDIEDPSEYDNDLSFLFNDGAIFDIKDDIDDDYGYDNTDSSGFFIQHGQYSKDRHYDRFLEDVTDSLPDDIGNR